MLTPYLVWIKLGAVVLLIGTGIWVKSVFAERSALRISEASAKATTEMYAKAFNDNQKLQEDIANAIRSIRITSNNRIQVIEEAPAPVGPVVTLIPAGVPQAVSSLPNTFTNNSTSRAGATPPAR